jgi:hypothetical protein
MIVQVRREFNADSDFIRFSFEAESGFSGKKKNIKNQSSQIPDIKQENRTLAHWFWNKRR